VDALVFELSDLLYNLHVKCQPDGLSW